MILDLAAQAYNALRHNRRRSVLTMLGMAWGIATVVLLLAYGTGFERGLWSAFHSFGTNWSSFSRRTDCRPVHQGRDPGSPHGQRSRLYPRRSSVAEARFAGGVQELRGRLWHAQRELRYQRRLCLVCRMRKMDVVEGTFFSEADDFTHTRVAVIGSDAKKKLFSGQNALARTSA